MTQPNDRTDRHMRLRNGTTWPIDADAEIAWQLRYSQDGLTRSDMLVAASILNVWAQLIDPGEPLAPKLAHIREIRRTRKREYDATN